MPRGDNEDRRRRADEAYDEYWPEEEQSYLPPRERIDLRGTLNSLRLAYLRRFSPFYRRLIALGALLLVLAIAVGIFAAVRSRAGRRAADPVRNTAAFETPEPSAAPVETPAAVSLAVETEAQPTTTAESAQFMPDTSTNAQAAVASSSVETWRSGQYAPAPEGEGYLPVFKKAERTDKVIAITVNDCDSLANLREILKLAYQQSGKLTLFPIGRLMQSEELQALLRAAHGAGFEIENHTWSHSSLIGETDAALAKEVSNPDRALDLVLNVRHQTHFLRPRDGYGRDDIRTHAYIQQLGYYGIAHWSVSGTGSTLNALKESLGPGEVYLFHCTDADLALLKEFIPYAVSAGYRLVTLNELFGYAENAAGELTDDPAKREVVPLAAYERDYKPLSRPAYSHMVLEVQEKLKQLGFLEGTPDGVFGSGTEDAVKRWQQSAGLTADGILYTDQLHTLLDE